MNLFLVISIDLHTLS